MIEMLLNIDAQVTGSLHCPTEATNAAGIYTK